MKKNILVCGGMPRSGTTYLFTELLNYRNVKKSIIKESSLFTQNRIFIKIKLAMLSRKKIHLDFTPYYVFDYESLHKIEEAGVPCFFIIRSYPEYIKSLNNYLNINKIKNNKLANISIEQYDEYVNYVTEKFPVFHFNEIESDPEQLINKLQHKFDLYFGPRLSSNQRLNSSKKRQYYILSIVHNWFYGPVNGLKSLFFGVI